jgi:hypothetical protein
LAWINVTFFIVLTNYVPILGFSFWVNWRLGSRL